MALLDVTDILLDVDFINTGLICERIAQVVGDDGIAVNTPVKKKFSGVVTNDAGDILQRIATGEWIKGSITIHSKFILSDGSNGFTADIVTWQNQRYTVSNTQNYSHFGKGFSASSCDLIPLSG